MKIYDCFTFFNEFELLELRLNTLNNIVDYFVIVEANKTQKNKDKEFNFEKNQERFKEYLNKIIYIKVEDMPEFDPACDNEWKLENYQRNCIMRGLNNSQPEDLVLISDVDEIPNPESILIAQKIEFLDTIPLAFSQSLFYYYMNCRSKGRWNGSIISKRTNISTPQKLRNLRNLLPALNNGGWHFSYLGGIEKILLKLDSIVEGPVDMYTPEHIKQCITNGLDIYGRKGAQFEYEFINIDQTFPSYTNTFLKKYPQFYLDKSS